MVHAPEATAALPISVSPMYRRTVAPLIPVPVKVGVSSLVMSSELLRPLSLAVARSRMAGGGVIKLDRAVASDSK